MLCFSLILKKKGICKGIYSIPLSCILSCSAMLAISKPFIASPRPLDTSANFLVYHTFAVASTIAFANALGFRI
jgi:hypothetical protein